MKSIDTKSFVWFFKKFRHVWLGGLLTLTMYFSTVDFATAIPSFPSSPTMWGEPHVGFIVDSVRINSLISLAIAGRPGFPFLINRAQCSLNRFRCHRITVSGLTNIRASFQSGQYRERILHRTLSAGRILALLTLRWRTQNWWRWATFTTGRPILILKSDYMKRNIYEIDFNIRTPGK